MSAPDPISDLRAAVRSAALDMRGGDPPGSEPTLERPPKPDLGDYSSNAAMLLAGPLGARPRDIAVQLAESLDEGLGDAVERIDVAGPGFINLFLSDEWFRGAVAALIASGDHLGKVETDDPERILVEFVSANPTGPLTAASGRHAAYGDSLSRILAAVGNEVSTEYYINDSGGQIQRFGLSISAKMSGGDAPEDGYEGEYIGEIARQLADQGVDPGDLEKISDLGIELMLEGIKESLVRYGVSLDGFFSERSIREDGRMDLAIENLRKAGHVYESDGALWLRTTAFGDDKDRVLIRADGEPTYMAPDMAYHADKLSRGFERLIDVWGADHHGYVARMRAAIEALGSDGDAFEVQIMQMVSVLEGGERSRMSKRRGDFVTLDEVIADIGADAARFFMLQRSHDSTVDLDLDLARSESSENPVYYVQYAHARIASILRRAGEDAEHRALGADLAAAANPLDPAERALVKRLLEFPAEIRESADRRAPHRLCAYSIAVAADFHGFYRDCHVVGAEGAGVEEFRLALCVLTMRTISSSLGLLGISAPDRM